LILLSDERANYCARPWQGKNTALIVANSRHCIVRRFAEAGTRSILRGKIVHQQETLDPIVSIKNFSAAARFRTTQAT
jgi:hypothetical protein